MMIIVITKKVQMKWNNRIKQHYMDKGYKFTKLGDEFKVHIEDLPEHSGAKIKVKCSDCGIEKIITYSSYNSKKNDKYLCGKCAIRKKGIETIGKKYNKKHRNLKKELFNLFGTEYEFLEDHIEYSIKTLVKHNKCGHIWQVTPYNLLNNRAKCPICSIKEVGLKNTKSNEAFKQEVYALVEDEYTFLEEYINSHTKIKCRHNKCGYEWEIRPNNFLDGIRCPHCYKKKQNKEQDIYCNEINCKLNKKYKNEFIFITSYKNNMTKIKIKCLICGDEYDITPSTLLQGKHKCLNCKKIKRDLKIQQPKWKQVKRDTNYVKKEINEITNGEYEFIGEFINTGTPISIKHNKCGYVWDIRIHDFIKGTRCPECYIIEQCKELGISRDDWGKSNGKRKDLGNWSLKVRKKDNHKCVICGSNDNLNAHHLDGYDWCVDKRKDVNNGVTLCENCHQNFHDIYGYGGNTKEQFTEYLKTLEPIQIGSFFMH